MNSNNVVKIVAITKAVKKFLINDLRVYQNKIQVISSASSLKMTFSKIRSKNRYNIGYFGSLEKSKGSQFIIRLSKEIKIIIIIYMVGIKKTVICMRKVLQARISILTNMFLIKT